MYPFKIGWWVGILKLPLVSCCRLALALLGAARAEDKEHVRTSATRH